RRRPARARLPRSLLGQHRLRGRRRHALAEVAFCRGRPRAPARSIRAFDPACYDNLPWAMDYKATLNLPKTDFPMKANLAQAEPRMLAWWDEIGIYKRLREAAADRPPWILHDGPPYANGNIHMGHVLNKVMKDL